MDTQQILSQDISNEYDYSNAVPTIELVTYLVKYCYDMYKQLEQLVEEDEEKNVKFKQEYKNYLYKKHFDQRFEIYVSYKDFKSNFYKDYDSFINAVKSEAFNYLKSLEIKLFLDFQRGSTSNLEDHINEFKIVFEPYNIKFTRNSNHNDKNMNQIEEQINMILKQFPIANSIFCSK